MQTVSGNAYGIAAANSGAGATRITAGSVSATAVGGTGIFVTNGVILDYVAFLADPHSADRNTNATDLIVAAGRSPAAPKASSPAPWHRLHQHQRHRCDDGRGRDRH